MSVRKGDRKTSELEVINLSKVLLKYTYERVSDEKTFPKAKRWLIAKNVWDCAANAHGCIIRANAIKVENELDAEKRSGLQKEAIGYLDALCSFLYVYHDTGGISDDRLGTWADMAYNTQNMLKAWYKANKASNKFEK